MFLDEIADLTLAAQARFSGCFKNEPWSGRGGKPIPISAHDSGNEPGPLCIHEGKQFREDLYYRIKVIHIQTPPLREIREDIPLLTNHFLEKHCKAMHVDLKSLTPAALQCLMRYSWPGNNRQLENEIKRLIASVRGKTIMEEHLDPSITNPDISPLTAPAPQEAKPAVPAAPATQTLGAAVEALERRMIEDALRICNDNKQKAAQASGLSRQGLIKKLKDCYDWLANEPSENDTRVSCPIQRVIGLKRLAESYARSKRVQGVFPSTAIDRRVFFLRKRKFLGVFL